MGVATETVGKKIFSPQPTFESVGDFKDAEDSGVELVKIAVQADQR